MEKQSSIDVYDYISYICLVYVFLVSKEAYTYTYARLSLHCSTFWVVGVVWHEPLFFLLRNIFCIATLYENYNNNAGQTVIRTSIPSSTTISLYLYAANRVQLENYNLIFYSSIHNFFIF